MTAHGFKLTTGTSTHDLDGVHVDEFLSEDEIRDAAKILARLGGVSTQTAERHLRNATGAELERLDYHVASQGNIDFRLVPTGDDETDTEGTYSLGMESVTDEPDTSCPNCDNEHTVGFSTGDRVCKKCNTNFMPGEDE